MLFGESSRELASYHQGREFDIVTNIKNISTFRSRTKGDTKEKVYNGYVV